MTDPLADEFARRENEADTDGGKQEDTDPGRLTLAPEALHGPAGQLVKAIGPHTEADPAGILLSFLPAFGNAVGPKPHVIADGTKHGARLNVVLVGDTARARKGTATNNVLTVMEHAASDWYEHRVESGLSSGEGLITAVRDGDGEVEGVLDKRLFIVEQEFARVLAVIAREGNTLSHVVRDAWDNGHLRTLTRRDPLKATGAHISIVGHVTREELIRRLSDTEMASGFANRFLFAAVVRSNVLPDGGNFDPKPAGRELAAIIQRAREVTQMTRSEEAKLRWDEIYRGFGEGPGGLLGSVVARPEAQTLRLSMIYALLDDSSTIEVPHLEAAYAVWDYAEKSAARIFGDSIGDDVADRLLEALRKHPKRSLDGTAQHELFGRHMSAARLERARHTLERLGLAETVTEQTDGRPRIVTTLAKQANKRTKAPERAPFVATSHNSQPGEEELEEATSRVREVFGDENVEEIWPVWDRET